MRTKKVVKKESAPVKRGPVVAADTANALYTENQKIGFMKHDGGMVGTAACVSLSKTLHLVLMAPTAPQLQEALKMLKLTHGSSPELVVCVKHEEAYKDHSHYVDHKSHEKAQEEAQVRAWRGYTDDKGRKPLDVVWVHHEASDSVCMIWVRDLGTDDFTELGDAVKRTELEAKLLLKRAGWEVADIRAVEISSINPDDEIPF